MAEIATEEERQILDHFAEGLTISEICDYTGLRRAVVTSVLARVCSYDQAKARKLLAEYGAGGIAPGTVPVDLDELPAAPASEPDGAWGSVPVAEPDPAPEPPPALEVVAAIPTPAPSTAAPARKRGGRPRKAALPPADLPLPSGPLVEAIEIPALHSPMAVLGEELDAVLEEAGFLPPATQEEQVAVRRVPRLVAAAAAAAPETLTSYVQWWCLECGGQYGRPFREHGAPARCAGPLQRVLVTVTRLDGPP